MEYGFIKVGAVNSEIKVADTTYNAEQIILAIENAFKKGVEVLTFPELSLTGATCGDLFLSDTLLKGAIDGLEKILSATIGKNMLIFIGMPLKVQASVYNVAIAICNGRILAIIPKTNLTKSEVRQFSSCMDSNKNISILGQNVVFGKKVVLCDSNNKSFRVSAEIGSDLFAVVSPSVNHAINGANLMVNLFAGASTVGAKEVISSQVKSLSQKLSCAYMITCAGEGESTTDQVYSGYKMVAENGKTLTESKLFTTGLIVTDVDLEFCDYQRSKGFNGQNSQDDQYCTVEFTANNPTFKLDREFRKTPFVPTDEMGLKERAQFILDTQAEGLKKRIKHTNAKCVVLGISGGLDSTLALIVSVNAMKKLGRSPKEVVAVTMPCFGTTDRTFQNACKLTKTLGATLKKVDIAKSVTRHLKDIKHPKGVFDVTYENAQARERTQVIMDIANMLGGLVVGTGDLSELALGWATYNGDHMSMYGVNGAIPKTLVRHLVNYTANASKGKLKAILLDVLDTPVSPELLPTENGKQGQQTEDIVGPYILHDFFMYYFIRRGYSPKKIYEVAVNTFNGDFKKQTISKWLKIFFRRFFAQQFKRSCLPDGVKVGSVGFSPRGDWQMPSDAIGLLWQRELEEL